MTNPGPKQLDPRLLAAGYTTAAIGYGVLLIGVARPGLALLAARGHGDPAVTLWLFCFGMFGAALIHSGSRLRRAYHAGMQSGF